MAKQNESCTLSPLHFHIDITGAKIEQQQTSANTAVPEAGATRDVVVIRSGGEESISNRRALATGTIENAWMVR